MLWNTSVSSMLLLGVLGDEQVETLMERALSFICLITFRSFILRPNYSSLLDYHALDMYSLSLMVLLFKKFVRNRYDISDAEH